MARIFRGAVSCLSALVFLVAATSAADPNDELLLALKEWEAATADVPQPLPDKALVAYRNTHNAHELEAAAELFGPVSARRLVEEYRWTLERGDSGEIRLHGEPRDVTTSLFFSGVDVVLDGATHRPASIQFVGVQGAPIPPVMVMATNTAKTAQEAAHQSDIQLVVNVTEPRDEPAPPRPVELESILNRWQEAAGRIETAEIRFHRYVYDHVYLAETRSIGRICFEAPNLGAYELEPVDSATDTQPARIDSQRGKYQLTRAGSTRIHWNGSRVWVIDLDQKSYDVWTIPEPLPEVFSGWSFFIHQLASPSDYLPAVINLSDDFLHRFQWKLVRDDDRGLMLQGTPISNRDRSELNLLQVLIDRDTFRTSATRIMNAMGSKETTHVLEYVSVNDNRVSRRGWVPDLFGLKQNARAHSAGVDDGQSR